jgi:hypothetical protein
MKRVMNSFGRYTKGDWVRFYNVGKLVIGQIEYIYEETGGFIYAATDQGPVDVKSILEVRFVVDKTDSDGDCPDTPKPKSTRIRKPAYS